MAAFVGTARRRPASADFSDALSLHWVEAAYAKVMELVFSSWHDIAQPENDIRHTHGDLA